MSIILPISVSVLILVMWVIPLSYLFPIRSKKPVIEVTVLLLLAVALPYLHYLLEEFLYGLAAAVTLEKIMFLLALQLILWLGALIIALTHRRTPQSMPQSVPRPNIPMAPRPPAAEPGVRRF